MKTKLYFLTFGLAAGGLTSTWAQQGTRPQQVPAADASASSARVQVEFVEPDKFSDLRSAYHRMGADEGYLEELQRHLQTRAANQLPEGYRLHVRITNVDMAGEFEPHRGATFSDVRIVKDIYPPRIELEYTLTDSAGTVIDQGQRHLRDLAFSQTLNAIERDDPLRYEKRLLTDFVRSLGRAPRG